MSTVHYFLSLALVWFLPKLFYVVQVTFHLYSALIFVFGPNLVSSETSLHGSGNSSCPQCIEFCRLALVSFRSKANKKDRDC